MGTAAAPSTGHTFYLLRRKGLEVNALDKALNYESVCSDYQHLLTCAEFSPRFHPTGRSTRSRRVRHRIRQTVGAMAATLGGIDALVFTAEMASTRRRSAVGFVKT